MWRTTLDYERAGPLRVNRGVTFQSGDIIRGLQDGRVVAEGVAASVRTTIEGVVCGAWRSWANSTQPDFMVLK